VLVTTDQLPPFLTPLRDQSFICLSLEGQKGSNICVDKPMLALEWSRWGSGVKGTNTQKSTEHKVIEE
jgi:hypothetical protein